MRSTRKPVAVLLIGGALLAIGTAYAGASFFSVPPAAATPILQMTAIPLSSPVLPKTPLALSTLSADATLFSPTLYPTPDLHSALVPMPIDPRMTELHDLYGIELAVQNCLPPCPSTFTSATIMGTVLLGDFIKRVGPPEKVGLTVAFGGRPEVIVQLIYAHRGIFAWASRPDSSQLSVRDMTPDMRVDRIDFWQSRTLEDLNIELSKVYKEPVHLEKYQDWSGFGPVRDHVP